MLNILPKSEGARQKLSLSEIPPTGQRNYVYLKQVWNTHKMLSFKDFSCWYNINEVAPNQDALKKMTPFYHNKGFEMLKRGCTLTNMANICLHSTTTAMFHPFSEGDKQLRQKEREEMAGRYSFVFPLEAVVDKRKTWSSPNVCRWFLSIDSSQLYRYAMCQPMLTGL